VRLFAPLAFPALGVTAALQTATRFLVANTTVARASLASATECQRITVEACIATFHRDGD